jgi:hypothetical protein
MVRLSLINRFSPYFSLFAGKVITIDRFKPRMKQQENDLLKQLMNGVYASAKLAGDPGVIDDVITSFGRDGKLCMLKAKKEYEKNGDNDDLVKILGTEVCMGRS